MALSYWLTGFWLTGFGRAAWSASDQSSFTTVCGRAHDACADAVVAALILFAEPLWSRRGFQLCQPLEGFVKIGQEELAKPLVAAGRKAPRHHQEATRRMLPVYAGSGRRLRAVFSRGIRRLDSAGGVQNR